VADTEVKADEPVKKAADKSGEAKHEGGKKGKGGFYEKHKIWIFGLGGVALVVIFIMMRSKSASSSAATPAAATAAIDPATGFPYGSAQDLAALSAQAGQSASGASGGSDGGSSGTGASSDIDPATGYTYGSPADIAALGGSGTTTTPVTSGGGGVTSGGGGGGGTTAAPVNGTAGESSPGLEPASSVTQITYAQAQALAGSKGSSSLYYSGPNTGGILHGKYANDPNVTYYKLK
jgi:hypothetical protein